MNPYQHLNFIEFFAEIFKRIYEGFTGKFSPAFPVSDELQLLILIGLSTSCALVGTFLVLRKKTMLANSISHTILLGIVALFVWIRWFSPQELSFGILPQTGLLLAALGTGFFTAFLTESLSHYGNVQEEASLGLIFTTLFSLGILLLTLLSRNAHIGTEVVMGSLDALHIDDLKLIYSVLGLNALLLFFFYRPYLLTTFDPAFAKVLGFSTTFYTYHLMLQVSITLMAGFRAVGVLMVLAFLTAPVLTARLWTKTLPALLFLSSAIGIASSFIGVALSRHLLSVHQLALSTGGLVVIVLGIFYLTSLLLKTLLTHFFFKENLNNSLDESLG